MSRKSKGINAERDLVHRFWKSGWSAVRVAGSGSMKYPSCDVLATNKVRRLAIECKASKDVKKYIPKEDILQLKDFSEAFCSESWIAVKFERTEWYFVMLEDLADCGKNFLVSKEISGKKGLKFEELIK